MKSMGKILVHYEASAAGVALVLLVLNLAVFIAFAAVSAQVASSRENKIPQIADGLHKEDGVYEMTAEARRVLVEQYQWAMLLNDDGNVVWSNDLPEDVPLAYTPADIASFTRWYLGDYPVYVWRHSDGLLVLGKSKDSTWKYSIDVPERVMDMLPAWLAGALVLNSVAAILLAFLFSFRLFRSLRPIAQGIEDMADKKPVNLTTGGLLGDLADKLNQTARELMRQREALEKRENARANWVAGVSHDIRTPLSMVMGYAVRLEEDPSLSDESRKQAEVIRRQSESIRRLIEDLNLATRLEYDMQPLRLKPVYPTALVRQVAADFLNNGLDKKYVVDLAIHEGAQGFRCDGDSALLTRAVSNLIGNSILHNPEGCTISVRVEKMDGGLCITVSDDGQGFPPKVLEGLMHPSDDLYPHTNGMGLAIVRQILHAHGGNAEFENPPCGGSLVRLWLPG